MKRAGTYWGLAFLGMLMAGPTAWAAAALQVEQAGGKTIVRATAGKFAAWRAATDTLVVVIPAESGNVEIGALPDGVTAEKVSDNGLNGLVLQGVDGSWQVVQDGANWLLRPGKGMKSESVLMLKDGWRVGNDSIKPQVFHAAGKTWQVGLVDMARSVAGSVSGIVRGWDAVPMSAKTETIATVAQVAAATGKVSPQEIAKIRPLPALKSPEPAIAALPAPRGYTDGKVSMEPAEPLRALGQPTMATAALPTKGTTVGRMTAVSLSNMLSRIEPAAGPHDEQLARPVPPAVSGLAAPHGMAAVAPPTDSPSRGLVKVAVRPAEAVRPISLGGVTAEVLTPVLGDIYTPGTLVSLTLPPMLHGPDAKKESPKSEDHATAGDVHGADTHGESEHAAVSVTQAGVAQVSRTWNQTTLAPIEAALAAAKAPSVTEPDVMPVVAEAEVDDHAPQPVVNRILPARKDKYFDEVSNAMQAIAETPENSTRERDAKMNLAGIYLAWQRPEEALAVLDGLPKRSDRLPVSAQARLYKAVAQLAKGDKPDAGLLDLGGPLGGHGKLWKAVAASEDGDYATALKIWPQERGLLPQYPGYLREMAQKAQVTALVMVGDRAVAMKVVDDLVGGYDSSSTVPIGLTRLQGLVRLGTPDESKGLEYLAAAAENMKDPSEAYRAKYEFVRALQQRNDLSDDQVRTYLTDLWFDWRGDELERDVLNTLAELYEKSGDSREALHYWQTLVRAYPKMPDLGQITEKMTNAFLRVFDPENPKVYDTLDYVGLYYDFSELVPNDARGDLVQEQVARLLVNANLWQRAVPILEQQLQYRPLDPAAQGRLALLLAEANGNLGQAGDGIKILDKWAHVATTSTLARDWKIEEAKLMLKLNRPVNATKALASLPKDDEEARDLRIEAAWAAQDWSNTIPLLEERLAQVPATGLVSDTGAQLATFRLAYAHGQLKQGPELEALGKRYEAGLNRLPQLSDDMGAVAASTGVSASVVASGPLAPVTGALNNLNRLTENVEATRNAVASQRKEQQEYNDKMRYMELLPPPAI